MRTSIFILILCFFFTSCDSYKSNNPELEPPYTARIAWGEDSELYSNDYFSHIIDDDYVYFYERPPGYKAAYIYALTKLDAQTGKLIWRAEKLFRNIILSPPIAAGDHIYVFLGDSGFICFNKETGEHTATVEVKVNEDDFVRMTHNPIIFGQYLYMCIWDRIGDYFTRLDVNNIDHENPTTTQLFKPEIIWQPEQTPIAKPQVHDNIIYTATSNPFGDDPVELAGFDLDTKQMVFYETFGGPTDDNITVSGSRENPIFIHEDTLYYLSSAVAAWDIKTNKPLFYHVFPRGYDVNLNNNNTNNYGPSGLKQAVYYKEKIYYSSKVNDVMGYKNIHCIDAKTGKLVWNTIVKGSFTLDSNVIIHNDKLYIAQHQGFYVYNPKNGKILGVDRSFLGEDMSRNVLYNDYIICIRMENSSEGKLVAVNVGD